MNTLYKVINFDELKDGQPVLAFGNHVAKWDFDLMGKPKYAIVPINEDSYKFSDDFSKKLNELKTYIDLNILSDVVLLNVNEVYALINKIKELQIAKEIKNEEEND